MVRPDTHPHHFDFHQAIRLLERELGARRTVGGRAALADETIRFHASPSLGFHGTPIVSASESEDGTTLELVVSTLTLVGASGVLPHVYTELLLERLSRRDRALAEFLDLFHHRTVSFFHRAWTKYRLPFAYEAAHTRGDVDAHTAALHGLVGLGHENARQRVPESPDSWLYFAGHFARATRSTPALEVMIEELVGAPVEVRDFIGRWVELSPEDRSTLTSRPGQNQLGSSLVLGDRVWDAASFVRIEIGPISSSRLETLKSKEGQDHRLVSLTRSYLRGEFQFEIVCFLDPVTISAAAFSSTNAPVLGATTWLASRDPARYDDRVTIWVEK